MASLEHLLNPSFAALEDVDVDTVVAAQAAAADWLTQQGSPEHLLSEDSKREVRAAFATVTDPMQPLEVKKTSLLSLRAPEAVRHLTAMLDAYDWDYVDHAKQIRGYVTAKLLEHSQNPTPRVSLKALELIGKLTEVGSFTERVQVTNVNASSDELAEKIRERLLRLTAKPADPTVTDAVLVDPPAPFEIKPERIENAQPPEEPLP